MITRREALRTMTASALVLSASPRIFADPSPRPSKMGLVLYCCGLRRNQRREVAPRDDLFAPSQFLAHCRQVGAGGMQISLGVLEKDAANGLRRDAEGSGLYIEAIIRVPADRVDIDRFEAEMQTAQAVGARAVRTTIIPGRRV